MKTIWQLENLNGSKLLLPFRYQNSEVDKICKYILNQPKHHKKESFEEEYQAFIKHYQATLKMK
jgi:hypothetical protein